MKQLGIVLGSVVVLSAFFSPNGARAEDEVQKAQVEMGKLWYDRYCTPCHGAAGAPGSAVYAATKKPVDLRDYVHRNGGKFPSDRWLNAVFNPRPGATHTEVWDKIRSAQSPAVGSDTEARGVVAVIAGYVKSFQTK